MKLRRLVFAFAFAAAFFTYVGFRIGVRIEKNAAAKAAALSLDHRFIQAAKAGNIYEMHQLLKLGANINATQTVGGFTALDRAAERGYAKAVQWLLDHGAEPSYGLNQGAAALDAAEFRAAQANAVVQALKARGVE
jgi:hypothetical protein